MRIAFIASDLSDPWGGSEVLWSQAALRLQAQGHAVFASVQRWPIMPDPIRALRGAGVEVRERHQSRTSLPKRLLNRARQRKKPDQGQVQQEAWEAIKAFAPDLVCVSQGSIYCGLSWMEQCLEDGIPYVSILHWNSPECWPPDDLALRMKLAHQHALKSYFVSIANLELFKSQVAAPAGNLEVIRNPFAVPVNDPPPWPDASSGYRLACVGRLNPAAKGQDLILEVLASLRWRHRNLSVSFYGSGPSAETLQALAVQLGVASRVRFAGYCSDVRSIWSDHHALLLPSRSEGLPLVIVEAMLSQRPCIVTDIAGNAELLEDGRTGFIAAAPTRRSLDEAMERAWTWRHQWRSMGQLAAQEVRFQIPADPAAVFAERLVRLAQAGSAQDGEDPADGVSVACLRRPDRPWGLNPGAAAVGSGLPGVAAFGGGA